MKKSPPAPQQLREQLEKVAYQEVELRSGSIPYRPALFAYIAAEDARFSQLPQLASPSHVSPHQLLASARTVMVVFLPFGAAVVESNRQATVVARLWAEAYVEANQLLASLMLTLSNCLREWGYEALAIDPTGDFDKTTLVARWSHRHAAVLAGLGQLGLNRMLITPVGCAGRLATLLTSAQLEGETRIVPSCTRCEECVRACPVAAFTAHGGFDRQACYRQLRKVARLHSDLVHADVCGKCVTGSCAIL